MQSVGADHEIEIVRGAPLEGDAHAGVVFFDGRNAVVEESFDPPLDGPIDGRGQDRRAQTGISVLDHSAKRLGGDSAHLSAAIIDDAHLPNRVAGLSHLRQMPIRSATV